MELIDWIIVIAAVAVVVGYIGLAIYKKMTGKSSGCGCGCSGCPSASSCGGACSTAEKEPKENAPKKEETTEINEDTTDENA